jgi:enoyl-CoA hydratase/carnithine racemase
MIERSLDGEVAVLRLAHGPVSAMDVELCLAIAEHLRALADEPVRAVVVTGTGKAFSAGVDLRRYLAEGAAGTSGTWSRSPAVEGRGRVAHAHGPRPRTGCNVCAGSTGCA